MVLNSQLKIYQILSNKTEVLKRSCFSSIIAASASFHQRKATFQIKYEKFWSIKIFLYTTSFMRHATSFNPRFMNQNQYDHELRTPRETFFSKISISRVFYGSEIQIWVAENLRFSLLVSLVLWIMSGLLFGLF